MYIHLSSNLLVSQNLRVHLNFISNIISIKYGSCWKNPPDPNPPHFPNPPASDSGRTKALTFTLENSWGLLLE